MSVELNPEIPLLDESSALYAVYMQLYQAFFEAQEKKSETNPFGIEEGDENSIRLKNTAYTFASAMMSASSSGGGGSGGGTVVPDGTYVKKSGDTMSGALVANYGLRAGINNTEAFRITSKTINNIVHSVLSITGKLEVSSNNLLIDGANVLAYTNGLLTLNGHTIKMPESLVVGSEDDGLAVSPTKLQYKRNDIYHSGNSNSSDVDWKMKVGFVRDDLSVGGSASVSGNANVLGELSVKYNESEVLGVRSGYVSVNGWVKLSQGIQINDKTVLLVDGGNVKIGAGGGVLFLGTDTTTALRLNASLMDSTGSHTIIDKYGVGSFSNGLSAKHNYGNVVFQTYRVDANNEGVIFPKNIRLGTQAGISISGSGTAMTITTPVTTSVSVKTIWSVGESTSYYKPQNQVSYSLNATTDAIGFVFKKPVEATNYIGIDGSSTRLTSNTLFFKDNSQLIAVTGGIKHYGDSYMLGNVSSEVFASGFSGYGWAILRNETTGSYTATFDDLVVRRKLQVYEFEVQKLSATNGSLWISDSCSGDTVVKL